MIAEELQSLITFEGKEKVLSVYLDTDLAHHAKEAVKLMFRERVKGLGELAPKEVREVEKFLDFGYDWQARGLAIFASGQALWKVIPLPLPVKTQVYWADKPYVRVLTDLLDRLGKYVIALYDREGVRLWAVEEGSIRAEATFRGEEVKRHKQGGWAATRLQRYEDQQALQNLKQALEATQQFCQEHGCKRLMLAGSDEFLAQVKDLLPKAMQSQVIGELTADKDASPKELLNRSLDLLLQADREKEQRLVEEAITAAAKGGPGVIGLADTLYALHQGQVRLLLVEENYHAAGHVCPQCGYVAAHASAKCPFCGHEGLSETPDVVNRAIHKAMETGADINIVRANEALTKAGGIAAILRYG